MQVPDVTTVTGLRDRALLELFYSTAVRRSEMTQLGLFDLDFERGTLVVRQGKGKKDRTVPVGERAALWVRKYVEEGRPHLVAGEDGGTLLISKDGEAFSPDSLTQLAGSYVKRSGVAKQGACHLRHTVATLMLEGGADIRYIQQMLGYAKLETTQIYTQVSIRRLTHVHTLTHPAALLEPRRRRQEGAAKTA
ncbi:MAG: tyrosine-type recombinase/integrase [Candidatus Dormibacteraeota bacterium]|nr:tyrosine-type recombinase/integrase [Candidatus Dormibacteraeota bacterium]